MHHCFLWVCVLLGQVVGAQAPAGGYAGDFRDKPLRESLLLLEEEYGLAFAFVDSLLIGKTTDCLLERAGWAELADCFFTANALQASPPGAGTIVLTRAPAIRFSIDLASVVVTDLISPGVSASPDGRTILVRPGLAAPLPGFVGEEVYRRAATLPGVTLSDEAAGNLSIRGGERDQNLVLFDGVPVYAAGHYFGMISFFAPELIDELVLHRGYAPARYGGKLSGVLELNTAAAPVTTPQLHADLNLLYGSAAAKLPLGTADAQLAVRRSLVDVLGGPAYGSYREQVFQRADDDTRLRNFRGTITPEEEFAFTEVNGRVRTPVGKEGSLTASAYWQDNAYRYLEEGRTRRNRFSDELATEGYGLGLSYQTEEGTVLEVSHTSLDDAGELRFREGRTASGDRQRSSIVEHSLRVEQRILGLTAGLQGQRLQNSYFLQRSSPGQDSLRITATDQSAHLLVPYLDYTRALGEFEVRGGLRLPYYLPTDRLYPEPRLSLSFRGGEQWLLKAALTRNHQFVNEVRSLQAGQLSSRATLWALAVPTGGAAEAQVAVGEEASTGATVKLGHWLLDVEGYYKRARGLPGLNFLSALGARGLRALDGRGFGLDLLASGKWRKGWSLQARYTWSRQEWRLARGPDTWFYADNDRRHFAQCLIARSLGRWGLSLGGELQSGSRYTPIRELGPGTPTPRPGLRDVNAARLPLYHRLDLTLTYALLTDSERHDWTADLTVALLNVYDQQNVLDRSYLPRERGDVQRDERGYLLEQTDRSGLGFTPNLGVRFSWK